MFGWVSYNQLEDVFNIPVSFHVGRIWHPGHLDHSLETATAAEPQNLGGRAMAVEEMGASSATLASRLRVDHPSSAYVIHFAFQTNGAQSSFHLPSSMPTRTSRRPGLDPKDRALLSSTQCRDVDILLKELRGCAQQLSPLESTLSDELRILERLYYKGVNQHRSALFWRRVEEMRKFGRRIADMDIKRMVEDLRFAFYLSEGAERQCVD